MKKYAPYLLYQVGRFGALNARQMLRICDGKCKRSSLYRTINELLKDKSLYHILNRSSGVSGYYLSKEAREFVFGADHKTNYGARACDLDHTFLCADILMELCRYQNVTGIASPFELSPEDLARFCHDRTPDGLFRLTQDGQHFEMALEVERIQKDATRVRAILERYWQTFKYGMECKGLLIVAMSATIHGMYTDLIREMPEEFQNRVRVVEGVGLLGLRAEAYGERTSGIHRCLDLNRTKFHDDVTYSPVKTNIYLSLSTPVGPNVPRASQQQV